MPWSTRDLDHSIWHQLYVDSLKTEMKTKAYSRYCTDSQWWRDCVANWIFFYWLLKNKSVLFVCALLVFNIFFRASVCCELWYLIVFKLFDPSFCNNSKNPSSNPPRLWICHLTLWYLMVGEVPTVRSSDCIGRLFFNEFYKRRYRISLFNK